MGDYISREAAYQFFKDQLEEETGAFSKGRNAGLRVAMSAVMNNDAIPAADARPVVLCRDCVYAYPYGLEIKCTLHSGRADRFGEDATYLEFHSENWYCADAQRKREKS